MSGLDEGLAGAVVRGVMHGLTPLRIGLPVRPIITDFSTRFFAVGSCFAQNAAEVLARLGFPAFFDRSVVNHYTTRTLRALLERWLDETPYREDELYCFADGASYCSPYHHALGARGPDAAARLLHEMTVRDRAARTALHSADIVLLTLGNATYLARPGGGTLCTGGGVPARDYQVRGQSVAEIRDDLEAIYRALERLCDKPFQLVITVSPQRYGWRTGIGLDLGRARDRIVASDLDKAKLRVAVDEFERGHAPERVEYFPSYEIVVDELRLHETFHNDAADHLHVAYPATSNYVVNRFLLSHGAPELIETLQFQRAASKEIERQIKLIAAPEAHRRLVALLGEARARHLGRPAPGFLRELVATFAAHHQLELARAHLGADLVAAVHDDPARHAGEVLDRALARLDGWVDEWRRRSARVLIYGAGRHTLMLLKKTRLLEARPIALADVAAEKMRPFFALPVLEPAQIATQEPDVVLISCVGAQEVMRAEIAQLGLPGVEVKSVYDPDELESAKLALANR